MISFSSNYYESSSIFHGSIPRIMGTRFDLLISELSKEKALFVWNKIVIELERLHKMINRFDAKSELSRININAQMASASTSNELWDILKDCKHFHIATEGLFDITLRNLSEVAFNEESKSIAFPTKDFYFDLGGYGKGYALEKIKKMLLNARVEHALINFGDSSISAIGNHPYGDYWSISIENPFQKGEVLQELKLRDQDFSSSGNLPTHTQHIINPYTKEFNSQNKLVCVCANNPIEAEVLSTTLMLASLEQQNRIKSYFKIDKVFVFNF